MVRIVTRVELGRGVSVAMVFRTTGFGQDCCGPGVRWVEGQPRVVSISLI